MQDAFVGETFPPLDDDYVTVVGVSCSFNSSKQDTCMVIAALQMVLCTDRAVLSYMVRVRL